MIGPGTSCAVSLPHLSLSLRSSLFFSPSRLSSFHGKVVSTAKALENLPLFCSSQSLCISVFLSNSDSSSFPTIGSQEEAERFGPFILFYFPSPRSPYRSEATIWNKRLCRFCSLQSLNRLVFDSHIFFTPPSRYFLIYIPSQITPRSVKKNIDIYM